MFEYDLFNIDTLFYAMRNFPYNMQVTTSDRVECKRFYYDKNSVARYSPFNVATFTSENIKKTFHGAQYI